MINPKKQLRVYTLGMLDNKPLIFTYQHRGDKKLISSLGKHILNLVKIVPKGMIVFFSSYIVLDLYLQEWKTSGLYDLIAREKTVCKEEKSNKKFQNDFNKFLKFYESKGAIFFGVCGGKLSEGIDFTDEMARMVVIVGVPFPSLTEPAISSKKEYLDKIRKGKGKSNVKNGASKEALSGQRWYFLKGMRSTNQAIGRVIRHKDDFGAILLIDKRYSGSNIKDSLSSWIHQEISEPKPEKEILDDLTSFFRKTSYLKKTLHNPNTLSEQEVPMLKLPDSAPIASTSRGGARVSSKPRKRVRPNDQSPSDSKPEKSPASPALSSKLLSRLSKLSSEPLKARNELRNEQAIPGELFDVLRCADCFGHAPRFIAAHCDDVFCRPCWNKGEWRHTRRICRRCGSLGGVKVKLVREEKEGGDKISLG